MALSLAAMPFFFFFSSARPLGRASWNEKKREEWAAALHPSFIHKFKKSSIFQIYS